MVIPAYTEWILLTLPISVCAAQLHDCSSHPDSLPLLRSRPSPRMISTTSLSGISFKTLHLLVLKRGILILNSSHLLMCIVAYGSRGKSRLGSSIDLVRCTDVTLNELHFGFSVLPDYKIRSCSRRYLKGYGLRGGNHIIAFGRTRHVSEGLVEGRRFCENVMRNEIMCSAIDSWLFIQNFQEREGYTKRNNILLSENILTNPCKGV